MSIDIEYIAVSLRGVADSAAVAASNLLGPVAPTDDDVRDFLADLITELRESLDEIEEAAS